MRSALYGDIYDIGSGRIDESLYLGEGVIDLGWSRVVADDGDEHRLLSADIDVGDGRGKALQVASCGASGHSWEIRE